MTNKDFSFDKRVARRYNAQRAHPPEISKQVGRAIAQQAGSGARVLEIGIGTGRIAWPVAAAGCQVVGIDISPNMLEEVHDATAQTTRPIITQADMHQLPFLGDSFGAVLAVHVLHLATDSQAVIREAGRVLQSGGAFMQGDDWMDPESVIGKLRDELRAFVVRMTPDFIPPSAGLSRTQLLADVGGTNTEEIIAAEWTFMLSPAERLAAIENRMDAESWALPPKLFDPALTHLREYAASLWPDLEQQQVVTRRFVLKVTRGEWH